MADGGMEVAARTICLLCSLIAATALAACDNSSNAAPPTIPPVVTLDGFGDPLAGILSAAARGNTQDLQIFANGQQVFTLVHTLPKLGPLFDSRTAQLAIFSRRRAAPPRFLQEVRVRSTGLVAQVFATDNILRLGPQLQGDTEIFGSGVLATPLGCQITSPGCQLSPCRGRSSTGFAPNLPFCDPTSASFLSGANCTAERQPLPLFGDGFGGSGGGSDPDRPGRPASRHRYAAPSAWSQSLGVRAPRVLAGKRNLRRLRLFTAASYLIEIGITNLDDPKPFSTCNVGQKQFGVLLNGDDDPKDRQDASSRANMDRGSRPADPWGRHRH